MGRLAVIWTLYRRPSLYPHIFDALEAQVRKPDELWVMYEDPDDAVATGFRALRTPFQTFVRRVEIPRDESGKAVVVPPSACINAALDETQADYIAYLTDDSLPHPEKYARMVAALDAGEKVVYCSQGFGTAGTPEEWRERITMPSGTRHADRPHDDPFCHVDHTQVAHARSDDRWPLGMDDIRWSDGVFFRSLVARFGPLQPIPIVLDYTCQLPDGISAR